MQEQGRHDKTESYVVWKRTIHTAIMNPDIHKDRPIGLHWLQNPHVKKKKKIYMDVVCKVGADISFRCEWCCLVWDVAFPCPVILQPSTLDTLIPMLQNNRIIFHPMAQYYHPSQIHLQLLFRFLNLIWQVNNTIAVQCIFLAGLIGVQLVPYAVVVLPPPTGQPSAASNRTYLGRE